MDKFNWEIDCKSINTPLDIKTEGGYSFEQIMENKNCSKDMQYWFNIVGTDRYLFQSDLAESWEFFDPLIDNPIRNTNQIYLKFKNVIPFIAPSNYYREHKVFTHHGRDTIGYNKFWEDVQEKSLKGFEVDGVRITGRHYFTINFGRFRAIPVDKKGKAIGTRKIWTFLRFIDLQYYLFNELEECFLNGIFSKEKEYLDWFPLKSNYDFIRLTLQNFGRMVCCNSYWGI